MLPHEAEVKFVVQDEESGCFLLPIQGDVGFTRWLHEAGKFDGYDEACDTASVNCHEGYFVSQVLCAEVCKWIQ